MHYQLNSTGSNNLDIMHGQLFGNSLFICGDTKLSKNCVLLNTNRFSHEAQLGNSMPNKSEKEISGELFFSERSKICE